MLLSQMPLGLQVPLVASDKGISRFGLYQTISPRLGLAALSPQAFRPQLLPLATVERLTLGARTRTSIKRFAGKRFLSDWNLEFPAIDLEPQDTVEGILPIGTESPTRLSEVATSEVIESSVQPSVTELDSTEASETKPLQLKSLHPEPTKSRNRKPNSRKQKQKKPKKLSNSQTKQLQSDVTEVKKQVEDDQFFTAILTEDEQWKQPQREHWVQADPVDELHPIAETHGVGETDFQANFQTELPELTFGTYPSRNTVKFYAQKIFNPVQSDVNPTQKIQQSQEVKTSLTKPKQRQKVPKKSSKQNSSTERQTNSPKLEQILEIEPSSTSENQDFNSNSNKIEEVKTLIEEFFDNSNQDQDHYFVDNQALITKDYNQAELIQNEPKRIDQRELPGEAEPLERSPETIIQVQDLATNNEALTGATFTHQIPKPTNSQILENFVDVKPQQTKLPLPIQGFSVGGQVKATTTPAQSIDPSDTVPAMLAPGEFVINATDAQKHLPLLHHINQGGNLEEPTQTQPSKVLHQASQITEYSSSDHEVDASVPTHLQSLPGLNAHQPLVSSETEPLQSGIFEESRLDRPVYKSPERIFRSQNIPGSSVSDFSNLSPTSSINEWASVEELLQMSNKGTSDSSIIQSAIDCHSRSTSLSSGLAVSETISNLSPSSDLQPPVRTDKQARIDGEDVDEAKTLEVVMETLAQEIYSRLRQRLAIERERLGNFSGRLPW